MDNFVQRKHFAMSFYVVRSLRRDNLNRAAQAQRMGKAVAALNYAQGGDIIT